MDNQVFKRVPISSLMEPNIPQRTFPKFSLLPPEIRAIIWELTFPEPLAIDIYVAWDFGEGIVKGGARSIDVQVTVQYTAAGRVDAEHITAVEGDAGATIQDSDEEDDPTGYVCLRPNCRLSVLLGNDFNRDVICANDPMEDVSVLKSHHACREARGLFLSSHTLIKHADDAHAPFYIKPESDILCLVQDLGQPHLNALDRAYGTQLHAFQTILINDVVSWRSPGEFAGLWAAYTRLSSFEQIRTVMIVADSDIGGRWAEATRKQLYSQLAARCRDRDSELMKVTGSRHKNWIVKYVDLWHHVFTEFYC